MTIQEIEKVCKKHGIEFLPPDDEIYREPPTISFVSLSPKPKASGLGKINKRSNGN